MYANCRSTVKHTPASVCSLAKSQGGDLHIGSWKGTGHGLQVLGPLISSKKPDTPSQEAFRWTGETELEPSNRPKRGGKAITKDEWRNLAHVRASSRMVNRRELKDDSGQGHPCSTVKLGFGHTAVSRSGRDDNS
jgi:hypothetical protein